MVAWLVDLPPAAVYVVLGVLAAAENVFPPIPADTIVAIGAFLSTTGPVSLGSIIGVTWGANAASAIAVYLFARRFGRPFFGGRLGTRLLKPKAMARLEHAYERHGIWGIFASRFIPGVRAVVPPFAGIAGLSPRQTIFPLIVASLLWYGALAIVASSVIREADEIGRMLRALNLIGLVAGVACLFLVFGIVVFRIKKRRD